jgi:hypothetical protein
VIEQGSCGGEGRRFRVVLMRVLIAFFRFSFLILSKQISERQAAFIEWGLDTIASISSFSHKLNVQCDFRRVLALFMLFLEIARPP